MSNIGFNPRFLPRVVLASWGCLFLCLGSLWLQYQAGVYQTFDFLWIPFALAGLATSILGSFLAARTIFRGPGRFTGIAWGVIGMGPVALSVAMALYMVHEQSGRNLPDNPVHKMGRMASISLIRLAAAWSFPGRLESDRLVMYYDGRIQDPQGDMERMEAHLVRLEGILGRTQKYRIHWVRGKVLGQSRMAIHAMALGSGEGLLAALDHHEVAHSFLYQFSLPTGEPPMLLLEGWAMAVEGKNDPLASTALDSRKVFAIWRPVGSPLRYILADDLYHKGIPFAYDFGGAFVDYFLRKYGPVKFLDFYNQIHPSSLEETCQEILDCSFGELEQSFWSDAENRAKLEKTR